MMNRARTWASCGLVAALSFGCTVERRFTPVRLPDPPPEITEIFELEVSEGVRAQVGGPTAASSAGPVAAAPFDAGAFDIHQDRSDRGRVLLDDVLNAVELHFPLLVAAEQEIAAAEAAILAASGNFDTTVSASARAEPSGFHEKEQFDLLVEQPTAVWGTSFFAGYRAGLGDFADYERDGKTNRAGELRVGMKAPLLQNRDIDRARFETWKAELERAGAEPKVQEARVEFAMKASHANWKWVSAGQKARLSQQLLRFAEDRQAALREGVVDGLFAEIILVENEQLVMSRRAALVAAERAFERAALGLSLYLRDEVGRPLRTTLSEVPQAFPAAPTIDVAIDRLVGFGLNSRPDARGLEIDILQEELRLELRENALLPRLDASVYASQDMGSAVSSPDDKGPFELGVGLTFELPLGRLRARGEVAATQAEITRLTQEQRFLIDKIDQEIRDALSALERAGQRIDLAQRAVDLAARLEEAERVRLEEGASDLIVINLREQQTARSAREVVDVQAEFFSSLATFRAALGLPRAAP